MKYFYNFVAFGNLTFFRSLVLWGQKLVFRAIIFNNYFEYVSSNIYDLSWSSDLKKVIPKIKYLLEELFEKEWFFDTSFQKILTWATICEIYFITILGSPNLSIMCVYVCMCLSGKYFVCQDIIKTYKRKGDSTFDFIFFF